MHQKTLRLFSFFLILTNACSSTSDHSIYEGGADFESAQQLEIALLNSGQGEAILISCPGKEEQLLIDAGESNSRYPKAEEIFLTSFERQMDGDDDLEWAMNTHPHSDHITGFQNILDEDYSIGSYIDNGANNPDSKAEERIRKKVKSYQDTSKSPLTTLKICQADADSEPRSDIVLTFLTLSPEQQVALNCPENLNDCSLVTKLQYGTFSLLLLADVTNKWEDTALKDQELRAMLPASVVKIGHHGAQSTGTDTSPLEFIQSINPELALISTGKPGVGTTKIHGFPQSQVLGRLSDFFGKKYPVDINALRKISACDANSAPSVDTPCEFRPQWVHPRILSTAKDGTIVVQTDGRTFRVKGHTLGSKY